VGCRVGKAGDDRAAGCRQPLIVLTDRHHAEPGDLCLTAPEPHDRPTSDSRDENVASSYLCVGLDVINCFGDRQFGPAVHFGGVPNADYALWLAPGSSLLSAATDSCCG
jgi:hypothetical protein